VVNINDRPVAVQDFYTVNEATSNNQFLVLANDSDPDAPLGDTLTISGVGPTSQGGTVVNGGSDLFYTPLAGFLGVEVFQYTIRDAAGLTAPPRSP